MKEYSLNAFVIGRAAHREHDRAIDLYTKELGRVRALAKGLRKITSKLACHLQPLKFVRVRLIEKKSFQIVDAKEIAALPHSSRSVELAEFIKATTAEFEPDAKLWYDIVRAGDELRTKGNFSYIPILRSLGFDPHFATCRACEEKPVKYFSLKNLSFLCARCAERFRAFNSERNELELIDIYVA